MIIGGLQTGNTRWLAAHLQNAADNESIELAGIRGTIARDVDGALAEFDAYALGTRAIEGVYAAFINPPQPLSRAQYMRAIALIEERLGLTGQPRIILFHVKNGREHCHIAWSRIDTRRLRAIHMSHDRQKLRRCAQELAAEFGLELPPGLAQDRGAERFDAPPQPTRAEKSMEARSGLSREERRALITQCYRLTDTAQAFMNALEAAGFMLARGDKRCFVVVDVAGDVHALARQIDGAKTKDVKKKLEGLTLSLLPPVERAKVLMARRAAAMEDAKRERRKAAARDEAAAERLAEIQKRRKMKLDLLWQQMMVRHWHEWKVLLAHIRAERERKIARRHWLAVGLALYLKKIAFIRQLVEYCERRAKRNAEEQYRMLMDGVRRRHENEAAELKRQYAAMERLHRTELASFAITCGPASFAAARHGSHDWQYSHAGIYQRVTLPTGAIGTSEGRSQDVTRQVNDLARQDFRINGAEITATPPLFVGPIGAGTTASAFGVLPTGPSFQFASNAAWQFHQNATDITGTSIRWGTAGEDDDRTSVPKAASSSSFGGR